MTGLRIEVALFDKVLDLKAENALLKEQIKFLESQLEALTKDSLDNSMGVSNIN
jgi:hypothetical protein